MLKSIRFLGEPILEQCLAGNHLMLLNEKGSAVFKIQTALIDLDFPLPLFGVDGTFGNETATAVSNFKQSRGISPSDGVVGQKTMTALDAEFVNEPRPLSPWFSNTTVLSTARDGNNITVYISGDEALPAIAAEIRATSGSDNFIYIIGWDIQLDFPLIGADPSSTVRQLLQDAVARGVAIRAMLSFNPAGGVSGGGGGSGPFGNYNNQPKVDFINGLANGSAIHDQRFIEAGTHHQKIIIIRTLEHLVAFSGGIDLNPNRVSWTGGQLLHDVHCRTLGPSAWDYYQNFVRRWQDHPDSVTKLQIDTTQTMPDPSGDLQAQVAWTFPNGTTHSGIAINPSTGADTGYSFATRGERSAKGLIHEAIAKATQFIYLQDQYLVDMDTSQALAAALPNILQLIILIEKSETVGIELFQAWKRRKDFIEPLLAIDSTKVSICLHNYLYVHSKIWIFDDEFAIIGSANCNRRGYTHDSEQMMGIYHPTSHNNWIRNMRIALWSQHLGQPATALSNPFTAINLWFDLPATARVSLYDRNANVDPEPINDSLWNIFIDPDGT
jgi:phosphatidylserine/phosphatidylglycerophosphate/cardiolipin synthase-like enzyme